MQEERIVRRVLVLADSPTVPTGFGVVMKNLLWELNKTGKYFFDIVGINYWGDYYPTSEYPYRLYPALGQGSQDMFGRPRFMAALTGNDPKIKGPWDLIFTLNDHFIIEVIAAKIKAIQKQLDEEGMIGTEFKWIGYWPVDSYLRENWVTNSINLSDYPVTYTDFGKDEILKYDPYGKLGLKQRLEVIYHGVDTEKFKPIGQEEKDDFREKFFGGKVSKSMFLVTNVNRNQPRKDIARTMAIFAEFKKRHPNSFLYLHAKNQDAGGSLQEIARNFGLRDDEDWTTPKDFNENIGFPVETLNQIYNISDVVMTTTLGEGWGLSMTESMAAGTLVLAPDHTSLKEIIGEDRGVKMKVRTTSSEWITLGLQDNERIRPLVNVQDGVEKLTWIYDNLDKVKVLEENALKWVKQHTWETIAKQWEEVFTQALKDLDSDREYKAKRLKKQAKSTPPSQNTPR